MSNLIEKIRKARERTVEAGGFSFVVRRPTDFEAAKLGRATYEDLLAYVVGWSGVQEIHLIPGGSAVDVPFDAALFREWIADRPDLWAPISAAIIEAYSSHAAMLEEAAKN